MKTQVITMIVVLFTLLSCKGYSQDNNHPTLTKTFQLNEPGTLKASSSGGSIEVIAFDENKVIIHAFVRKNGRLLKPDDASLQDILDDYQLIFEKDGNAITAVVKSKYRFKIWNNTGISLQIMVPEEMSCTVASSGGGVKVSGVSGKHKISSSGGGVKLNNVSGYTEAKSSGGSVKVKNQSGNLYVSSSGGSVSVEEANGDVRASSSGGGVQLSDINGEVEASSSGGGVTISGRAGGVRAKSSGGSVKVTVSSLEKELYLSSSGGGVYATILNGEKLGLDLDLRAGRVHADLKNFSGNADDDRVKGIMNGGGIPIYMHASGGNVHLKFHE